MAMMTRLIFGALAVALAATTLAPRPAEAAPYWPWCSQYFNKSRAHACAFISWEQCMQTVSGIGGYCYHNLEAPPAPPASSRRHARG